MKVNNDELVTVKDVVETIVIAVQQYSRGALNLVLVMYGDEGWFYYGDYVYCLIVCYVCGWCSD